MSPPPTAASPPRTRRAVRKTTSSAPAKSAATHVSTDANEPIADATARPVQRQNVANAIEQRDGMVNEVSDAWYQMARGGQTATLDALRKVVDVVVPLQGDDESRRRKLIDGAFELADRAAAAPLGVARGALQGSVLVYFDVDVNVDTDVDAFTGVDVGVTVPTNVKTLSI